MDYICYLLGYETETPALEPEEPPKKKKGRNNKKTSTTEKLPKG